MAANTPEFQPLSETLYELARLAASNFVASSLRRGMLNQLRVNPVATHQESVEEQAALTLDLYGHVLNGTQAAAQLLGMCA
jgi:hypothetical protein